MFKKKMGTTPQSALFAVGKAMSQSRISLTAALQAGNEHNASHAVKLKTHELL